MKLIHYSDTEIMTSDAAADAVLDYAAELARRGHADVVVLPAVGRDGALIPVRMLVGPTSQLVSEPAKDDEMEPDTDEFVLEMRDRIEAQRSG